MSITSKYSRGINIVILAFRMVSFGTDGNITFWKASDDENDESDDGKPVTDEEAKEARPSICLMLSSCKANKHHYFCCKNQNSENQENQIWAENGWNWLNFAENGWNSAKFSHSQPKLAIFSPNSQLFGTEENCVNFVLCFSELQTHPSFRSPVWIGQTTVIPSEGVQIWGVFVPIWLVLPRREATNLGVFGLCDFRKTREGWNCRF